MERAMGPNKPQVVHIGWAPGPKPGPFVNALCWVLMAPWVIMLTGAVTFLGWWLLWQVARAIASGVGG